MAGTMGCSLLFVIILLISTVSGVIETSFVKGVPRLNNSLYCDYYFACHTEGETLQWTVGNNIFNYSGQSTIGSVFDGSVSNCNYTATLLSLNPLSSSRSFKSALILTCQSNFDMSIICSDGSSSKMISIPEKELSLMAETSNNSIYLEHVLFQNLVNADNSTCTNVFVCGVNNDFMNVQLGNARFLFTELDSIGRERSEVQGTSVLQQAIVIDKEPFSLVVAMFIVGNEVMNVTCGFSQNIIFLSGMQCRSVTTMPMPETTGTMESESSTVGESSTMASEGVNNLPLILGLNITLGVLFAVAAIIITSVCCKCCKTRSKINKLELVSNPFYDAKNFSLRSNPEPVPDMPLPPKPVNEPDSEIPLMEKNSKEIKKQKKKVIGIDYNEFFQRVQYIFLTRNDNTFNAATTIVTAPDIENKNNELTVICEGVYIGMIKDHPVCIVNNTENNFVKKLENVIIRYFPNAKYLIFVGRCFAINPQKVKLADVLISKSICHVSKSIKYKEIAPEITGKFCLYPKHVDGLKVSEGRKAKHLVVEIASGVNILDDADLRKYTLGTDDDLYGCEETSGELLSLYKNGIRMENNNIKQMQVIAIGAVIGYVDGDNINEYDEWLFTASKAAFHYVAGKIIYPHMSGSISYEIKKPKPRRDNMNYDIFARSVEYIIIAISQDEFDAVSTHVSALKSEETIVELVDNIYIGRIGSHSVGLLYSTNEKNFFDSMKNAINKHFPYSKYLVHVGGCFAVNQNETDLGDVLISKQIHNIDYDGESYHHRIIEMTPEIQNIFCNSDNFDGLLLPGNRRANHFEVRIATGTGAYIHKDKDMQKIAIESKGNCGYDEIGGELLRLQEVMVQDKRKIHFILINGVCCYKYSRDYIEWNFVATQAAIHYVAAKMEMQ